MTKKHLMSRYFGSAVAAVAMFGIHAASADDGSFDNAHCFQNGAWCAAHYAEMGYATGVECWDANWKDVCPAPTDSGITTSFEAYGYYSNPGTGPGGVRYCNGRLGCMDTPEQPT